MPELPEVETTRRGIEPHLLNRRIVQAVVREPRLRRPIPADLARHVENSEIHAVQRRGKYLLLHCGCGHLLIHLGMSGSLRIVPADTPVQKHEHFDLVLDGGHCLRYRDPRRFGLLLWTAEDPAAHPLLAPLGPEPLGPEFDADYLKQCAHGRKSAIKPFLMDSHVVVGVGNIYANESLFSAGIHPARAAGRISLTRCKILVHAVREVLGAAIAQGGTTLRDFVDGEGKPGYFKQSLNVYGRAGEPCVDCARPIQVQTLGRRATYFCPHCQR